MSGYVIFSKGLKKIIPVIKVKQSWQENSTLTLQDILALNRQVRKRLDDGFRGLFAPNASKSPLLSEDRSGWEHYAHMLSYVTVDNPFHKRWGTDGEVGTLSSCMRIGVRFKE